MPEHTPKYFRSYSPKHRVKFIRNDTGEDLFDVSDDLISLSTNKAYERAAGTWQIMLTYKRVPNDLGVIDTYDKHINTDDIVTIELDAGDGNGYQPVMMGLVDRVSFVRQGGNNPQRQVKISGQDMGKLLIKHDVGWDIVAFGLETAKSGDDTTITVDRQINRQFDVSLITGTPKATVEKLFKKVFADVLPKWEPYIKLDASKATDDWNMWNPAVINLQNCKMWDLLTMCSHLPFNVLTADTTDIEKKKFTITLEPRPIDDNGRLTISNDRRHMIFDTDIISDDVGICDTERINFLFYQPSFYLVAANMSVAVAMAHPDLVIWLESSIDNHGYCPKIVKDEFIPTSIDLSHGPPPLSAFIASAKDAKDKLWNWYKLNHTYWSGTVQTHLRPEIKAGNELIHDPGNGKEMSYLIEQVSHHYVVWPQIQFVTTLHVTRGQLL